MAEDSRLESPTDEELVQRVREGEERAMNVLVDRHHGVVFRSCAAILSDEDLAADASQNSFLKAFRAIDRFRGEAAFRTWLLAIAGNEARVYSAKLSREGKTRLRMWAPCRPRGTILRRRLFFDPKSHGYEGYWRTSLRSRNCP